MHSICHERVYMMPYGRLFCDVCNYVVAGEEVVRDWCKEFRFHRGNFLNCYFMGGGWV